jgi:hypothetical protein
MDCFVASLLAMAWLDRDTASRSRGMICPSLARILSQRGSGECRVRAAPAVSCANARVKTHTSIQVQRKHSGIPRAMALRLMARSPRRRILSCHRRRRISGFANPVGPAKTSADLTPATGAGTTRFCRTQPPVFAKRLRRARRRSSARRASLTGDPPCDHLARRRCRVHRISSRVRDDHDTPLLPGETGGVVEVICPTPKQQFCPTGQFVAGRRVSP